MKAAKPRFDMPPRFDDVKMHGHGGTLLAIAGRAMEEAYQTSLAIGAIAGILRGNGLARECDGDFLDQAVEDGLLAGIEVLSNALNSSLDHAADIYEERLKDTAPKGDAT